ncbi:hypothetical protein DACRYDRAFT_99351 [Dacryopinax primogenitus]|uniref:Uncharacterized protein n=1 Tax=Dacryopinax primogenitus (strain DJM 731) TaxID=1858805 RepID=M5G0T6_DACPD|nr:uncharacterized protein DACRYDRAFT_99351 [Dacryopinax primogenitus]EJU03866.1 hypothetical protein DACRYDRAFT_99351 [Dacryopinax primogenitus]
MFERLREEYGSLVKISAAHRRVLAEDQATLTLLGRERDYLLDILHTYPDLIPAVKQELRRSSSPPVSNVLTMRTNYSNASSPPISPILSSSPLPTPANSLAVIPEQLKQVHPSRPRAIIPTPQQMQTQARRPVAPMPLSVPLPVPITSNNVYAPLAGRKRRSPPSPPEGSFPLDMYPPNKRISIGGGIKAEEPASHLPMTYRPYLTGGTSQPQPSRPSTYSPPPLPPGPLPRRALPTGPSTRQYTVPMNHALDGSGALGLRGDYPHSNPMYAPPGVKEYSMPWYEDRAPLFPTHPSHHYPQASIPPTYTGPNSPIQARRTQPGPYDTSLLADDPHREISPADVYPDPRTGL